MRFISFSSLALSPSNDLRHGRPRKYSQSADKTGSSRKSDNSHHVDSIGGKQFQTLSLLPQLQRFPWLIIIDPPRILDGRDPTKGRPSSRRGRTLKCFRGVSDAISIECEMQFGKIQPPPAAKGEVARRKTSRYFYRKISMWGALVCERFGWTRLERRARLDAMGRRSLRSNCPFASFCTGISHTCNYRKLPGVIARNGTRD